MSGNTNLFIESTEPNGSYTVIWRGENGIQDVAVAMDILSKSDSNNRLELWSKAHAESPLGFAPMAFREKGSRKVMISEIFRMLTMA